MDIKSRELEYKEYIDEHRMNVQKAWDQMKCNTKCMHIIIRTISGSSINSIIELIDNFIRNHDLSKYSKEEFDAYRKQFFPTSNEEKESNKEEFDKAWEHHYRNNLHHWDWWFKSGNKENMPLTYVVEMVCDWIAMGFKFNNKASEWYESEKKKNNIHLGATQTKLVEELLSAFYE